MSSVPSYTTKFDPDAGELIIDIVEQMNLAVAASFDGTTDVTSEVFCDPGGIMSVHIVLKPKAGDALAVAEAEAAAAVEEKSVLAGNAPTQPSEPELFGESTQPVRRGAVARGEKEPIDPSQPLKPVDDPSEPKGPAPTKPEDEEEEDEKKKKPAKAGAGRR